MFTSSQVEKLIEQAYLNGIAHSRYQHDYKKSTAFYEFTKLREKLLPNVKKLLITRIRSFLTTYAKTDANGDYNSSDAYELEKAIENIQNDRPFIRQPFSEWGSGGYHPYTSKDGQQEHDSILKEISNFSKCKTLPCPTCENSPCTCVNGTP